MPESLIIQPATRQQPWNEPWAQRDLEHVHNCPVCSGTKRTLLYGDKVDNVFYCAPGKWTSYLCSDCGSMYLDPCPCPSPASIHLAYEIYYTHQSVGSAKVEYSELTPLRRLRRLLGNGYTNWRFATRHKPSSFVGIVALLAAWPYRAALDSAYRHLPTPPAGGGVVLDVGCGSGDFLKTAHSCGWQAVGLDPDTKALAICRSRGLDVRQGGIEQFDGQQNIF